MQEYNKLDQKIHQLAQTIAKFNRNYVPKKADDSHTNLAFDPISNRLLGRWVKSSQGPVIMALDLGTFKFEILDSSWKSLYNIGIEGKTQKAIELSIKSYLPQLGLESQGFMNSLHFEITTYDFIDAPYSLGKETEVSVWTQPRSLANDVCHWLLNHLQCEAEVRIWPHHFDTGIYFEANSNIGLGFGLAMEDEMVGSPYYYLSGYGLNGHKIDYSSTQPLKQGAWITNDNWNGAILKLSHANQDSLMKYVKEVSSWYVNT